MLTHGLDGPPYNLNLQASLMGVVLVALEI
jgi:hypothetical protein